jgi:flagellar biosynthesis protein FliP
MEQSSANEDVIVSRNNETIETCMNDEIMEKNVSVQTETSRNPENEKEEQIKIIFLIFACTKKRLETTWKIIFVLEIFYYLNDNAEIGLENTQIMYCILCYQEPVIGINSKTRARKD